MRNLLKNVLIVYLPWYLSLTKIDETPTERQLTDVNRRYDDLLKNMQFRIEDLNLSRQYIERDGKVGEQLDWVTATETKLAKSEPRIPATEIEPLEKEIENLEVRSITSLTCHYLEQEIGIVYLKI